MAIKLNAAKESIGGFFGRARQGVTSKAFKIFAAAAVFLIVMTALGVGIYDNVQKLMSRRQSKRTT